MQITTLEDCLCMFGVKKPFNVSTRMGSVMLAVNAMTRSYYNNEKGGGND